MDKKSIISLAEELLQEEHLKNRKDDLVYLKRQYKILLNRDDDSYYEQQLTDKFVALFQELAKKEPDLFLSPIEEKKRILLEMKKLLNATDFVKASKEIEKLSDDFKHAGRCSKEQDDEFWAEFKQTKDEFYAKKKAYYEELDKSNQEKREKKEDIIARAKEVCEHIDNVRESTEKMDALMKEWKAVGYTGKGDDYLWKEFSKVLDDFREKKKEHHQEMLKLFDERANKKEELIKKMKVLLANSDFSEEEVKKVKDLRNEFNKVGFTGKEKDDDLYQRFNQVVQKYYEEKKFYTA